MSNFLLSAEEVRDIVRVLGDVPGVEDFATRTALLRGVRLRVSRHAGNPSVDLLNAVSEILNGDPQSLPVLLANGAFLAGATASVGVELGRLQARVADAIRVQLLEPLRAIVEGSATLAAPRREAVLTGLGIHDFASWVASLQSVARRVARVTIRGAANGTAFLVGEAAVLTNYHVVEPVFGGDAAREVRLCFDAGDRDEARSVTLDANWLIDRSPYEGAPGVAPDGQLDYALLRLAEPVGRSRGWISLRSDTSPLVIGSPLVIVQHPGGRALSLAFDSVLAVGPRSVRYRTNTEPGSSGSPCLDPALRLVALHHLGHEAAGYNEGIPIASVARRIEGAGFADVLGA